MISNRLTGFILHFSPVSFFSFYTACVNEYEWLNKWM